jgi:hypothetical protein
MSRTTERTAPFDDLWQDWLDELTALLASPSGARSEVRRVDRVALSIATSLADRPALCELMAAHALRVLGTDRGGGADGRGASDEPGAITEEHLGRLGAVVLDAVPRLGLAAANRFGVHLLIAVAGLWWRSAGEAGATAGTTAEGRHYRSPAAFAREVETLCRDLLLGLVPRTR